MNTKYLIAAAAIIAAAGAFAYTQAQESSMSEM